MNQESENKRQFQTMKKDMQGRVAHTWYTIQYRESHNAQVRKTANPQSSFPWYKCMYACVSLIVHGMGSQVHSSLLKKTITLHNLFI